MINVEDVYKKALIRWNGYSNRYMEFDQVLRIGKSRRLTIGDLYSSIAIL